MKWQDLPESNNVDDRRGQPEQGKWSLNQVMGKPVKSSDMRPNPDTDPELPKALGIDEIG